MQSPVTTAFRVVVMLSCLIAIPAVAICGKSLPGTLRGLIEWGWHSRAVSVSEGAVDESSASPSPHKLDEVPSPASLAADSGDPATGVLAPELPPPTPRSTAIPRDTAGLMTSHEVPARLPEVGYRVPLAPTGERPEPSDQLTRVRQRLLQLGATYCRLETWGSRQQLFRFYCRVAIADSPRYTRYFEATDVQPLVAMDEVLAEVEAWRLGH